MWSAGRRLAGGGRRRPPRRSGRTPAQPGDRTARRGLYWQARLVGAPPGRRGGSVIRPTYRDDLATLVCGDALVVLAALPERSVDALVTDPPAGIAFMGRDWDTFPVRWRAGATFADGRARPGLINGQEHRQGARDAYVLWLAKVMSECRRVLKPGAHALVWSIPRTSHWVAAALEDAGFEIRDAVHHLFGQGFPKS